MLKKYSVRIPSSITYIYIKSRNIIIFKHLGKTKICKLNLILKPDLDTIYITDNFVNTQSKFFFKKIKSYRGLEVSTLKQALLDLNIIKYKQLNLVGIGYRAFIQPKTRVLVLKLGYSHEIFIKIPSYLKVICPKPNTIFVSGSSIDQINLFIKLIRSYREPEPYKGKGILYEYEQILLKEGKNSK